MANRDKIEWERLYYNEYIPDPEYVEPKLEIIITARNDFNTFLNEIDLRELLSKVKEEYIPEGTIIELSPEDYKIVKDKKMLEGGK